MMSTQPARHDAPELTPVGSNIVTTWPVGTFVENICALPDGDFLVSIENKDELQRVRSDGAKSVFARLPLGPTGIVQTGAWFFVLGGDPGRSPGAVFRVGSDGTVDEWLSVAESLFLNGFTPYEPARALAVDSIKGLIISVNLERPEYEIWFEHELLTKISAEPMLPGVNGIKLYDGAVYLTNTDRALIIRIPFAPTAQRANPRSLRSICAETPSRSIAAVTSMSQRAFTTRS